MGRKPNVKEASRTTRQRESKLEIWEVISNQNSSHLESILPTPHAPAPKNSFCSFRRSRIRNYYSEMSVSENIT